MTDPAATVNRATGHQMVSLCRSFCEEEKAQLLSPFMNSKYFPPCSGSVVSYLVYIIRFSVGRTEWSAGQAEAGTIAKSTEIETSNTSGDETVTSRGRQKILSKMTFRMKKVYAATELGRFFVTRPSDAANIPSRFYCRVCRKNVSVLTHGHHEMLRYFQGSRRFARDQRLRLETPGWRVLDFQGNPLTEGELSWSVRARRSERVLL